MNFERPEIFRPPSERRSYFLPLTKGCSNNTCTFCSYYGTRLQIREIEDIKREIDTLVIYMKDGVRLPNISTIVYLIARNWDGRRVFLQDGDALVYPFAKLVEILQYLNNKFPNLERIATYTTAQDALRKSLDELKTLHNLKLDIVYLGVETGDEELLRATGKDLSYSQMVEAGRKIKQAGIELSATVILGLAGSTGSQKHSLETAKILTDMDPDYVGALTLTLVPNTPLSEQVKRGDFHLISPLQTLEELRAIIENSSFTNCFFSSMHASNYFSIRGRLPQEKEGMLRELDDIISKKDPSLLRPEVLRGL